jgi:putative tricarboxylic transport membrane protein
MHRKRIHADVYVGVFLEIICLLFWILANGFRVSDAAMWPRAVIIIVVLLSGIMIARGVLRTKAAWAEGAQVMALDINDLPGVLVAVIVMIVYAVAMKFVGFFISTAIFLPSSMFVLGQRKWLVLIGTTVGIELFVWFLFVYQLKLRMP